jgi:site-specific recombinase
MTVTPVYSPDVQAARSRLEAMDTNAPLALRHVWLVESVGWLRGPVVDVPGALSRFDALLTALESDTGLQQRWHAWWQLFVTEVDMAPLLADFGFASQAAFWGELVDRLRRKTLPVSPQTRDAAELFGMVLNDPHDARWLRALPSKQLARWAALMPPQPALTMWEHTLLDAVVLGVGQVTALGFRSDVRLRMSNTARAGRSFHELPAAAEAVRRAWQQPDDAQRLQAVEALRHQLDAARHAAYSVYGHFEEHGISVSVVFKVRQLRERIIRIKQLLEALVASDRSRTTAKLLSHLVEVRQDSTSIKALVASSTQLTAARVAERSAETGEQYITRNWAEYRTMLWRAGGGGFVLGFTTWFKFLIAGLALSAFWGGLAAGINYALAFVLIQLLHLTVATKQPAVTAPAMVAKLRDLQSRESVLRFVDEVAHLFRSQVAAIAGNVGVVVPTVLALHLGAWLLWGQGLIDVQEARHVLDAHHLLGPTVLFAAMTGVLLFASSIVAGWVENWFVLHKLDSAMAFNPKLVRQLGSERAQRWAHWLRLNISGLAANVSLGLMLGLVPPLLMFFGLGADVRHVTLVMGQLAAAVAALGWGVFVELGFWMALLAALLVGPINLAVSFYLAFRLALKAQNVSEVNRQRIQKAIVFRFKRAPRSFFWPPTEREEAQAHAPDLDLTPAEEPERGRV